MVQRSRPDTIFFSVHSAVSRQWLETPVSQDRITRLDVRDTAMKSPGRILAGVVSGTLIGAAVGGALVYFTYQAICPTRDNDCDGGNGKQIDRRVLTTFGAVGVGVAGGVLGAIIGGRPVPGWRLVFFRP